MVPSGAVGLDPDTVRLTAGLAAADEEAFREFHARYFERLFGFLLMVCRGSDDQAEEALQLTLLRVVRRTRVFRSEDEFWCWLKAVARSAAYDAGRKQRRYAALLDRFAQWCGLHHPQTLAPPEGDPLTGRIEALLADLDPLERQLVEGKYLAGESVKELSVHTGLSEKAVEGRLTRLRQRLRGRFLDLWRTNEP